MKIKTILMAAVMSTLTAAQVAADDFNYTNERFADLQMLRYKVSGYEQLSLRQKTLVYYLSQAALCGRDILADQNGAYNLRIRQMLETVYTDYQGDRNSADFKALEVYLKRVWFSNGIHHHYGSFKLTPEFSQEFFRRAERAGEKYPLLLTSRKLTVTSSRKRGNIHFFHRLGGTFFVCLCIERSKTALTGTA